MLIRFRSYAASIFAALMLLAGNANAALDLSGVKIEMTPFETVAALVLVALGGFLTFVFCKKAFSS